MVPPNKKLKFSVESILNNSSENILKQQVFDDFNNQTSQLGFGETPFHQN